MLNSVDLRPLGSRVYLVSCVSKKGSRSARAKDLYVSDWFVKARTCIEKTGNPWFILSAKYGLVHPETVISPYEQTLNTMPAVERRAWSVKVLNQLELHLAGVRSVVFLAGERYRQHLEPALKARGIDVAVPLGGLRIGEQLREMKNCQ